LEAFLGARLDAAVFLGDAAVRLPTVFFDRDLTLLVLDRAIPK